MNISGDKLSYLLIGAAFLIGGIVTIIKGKSIEKRCTEEAEGTITEIINKGTQRMPSLYPVISFTAKNGENINSSCSYTYKRADKHKMGQTLTIRYNPENPGEFFPSDEHRSVLSGLVIILFGIAAVLHAFNILF